MNMFVIAAKSEGKYLYGYHPHIYANRKQAENALKTMRKNGKLTERDKVYGLDGLLLVDL
ncbi:MULTISPECIES: hypothetical protein [Bacillus]|uniref:hypothetical protein n=1 Tax=Bacillus TaxID=1386 RepID=UPI001E56E734|nr:MULTISPECIES: hypothetical protein [Bacillus]MDR4910724.1 hypothetical protein [Bacillus subtilis]UEG55530.1 hypothetical protein LK685_11745 [Bacillus sp. BC1-43]UJE04084.1 hypothetical protein HNV25_10915 [Bacillus subtilis]